jgi:hypothetical protein
MAKGVPESVAAATTPLIEAGEAAIEKKIKRKASSYAVKYGKAFKKISKSYMKKGGGWKQNGFKNAQKAAHAAAKKGLKR